MSALESPPAQIDDFPGPRASPLPGDVVRALAWLRERPAEDPSLAMLAAAAGVRPRTLQAHFAQFLGTSPRALARRMRLARVRRQLMDAPAGATVTAIAHASGFRETGRFAGEYRRRYGEAPSQTLRRASRLSIAPDVVDDEALRLASRALAAAFAVAPGPCANALEDALAAQAIAPSYALPKAIAAWCLQQRSAQRFRSAQASDGDTANALVREACALAPDDPLVLTLSAGAMTLARRLGEAELLVERALALDPAAPWAWLRRGWLSAYAGDSASAMGELRYSLHLMPFEPIRHLIAIGIGAAHFAAERYERAAVWAREGVDAFPDSFWAARIVAAAAAHAGAREEARRVVRSLRRRDPELTADEARGAWPFPATFNDRLGDGLEKAGLPRG